MTKRKLMHSEWRYWREDEAEERAKAETTAKELDYVVVHYEGCKEDPYTEHDMQLAFSGLVKANGGMRCIEKFIQEGQIRPCSVCKPDLSEFVDVQIPEDRRHPSTYTEIAKYIDRTNGLAPSFEALWNASRRELDYGEWFEEPEDDKDSRLQEYALCTFICTDTHVGIDMIFLDDEFVAMRHQRYRKGDISYKFVDREAENKVMEYLESFIKRDEDETRAMYITDPQAPEYLSWEHQTPVRGTEVVHEGRSATVINTSRSEKSWGVDQAEIQYRGSDEKAVVELDQLVCLMNLDWDRLNADRGTA